MLVPVHFTMAVIVWSLNWEPPTTSVDWIFGLVNEESVLTAGLPVDVWISPKTGLNRARVDSSMNGWSITTWPFVVVELTIVVRLIGTRS